MSKKNKRKIDISEVKKEKEKEKDRIARAQIPIEQRLAESERLGIVIAQNNPDNCIYAAPILKRLYYTHNVEIHLYIAPPFNDTYLPFLGELPYVESVNILDDPQINDEILHEIEDINGVVLIINYMMAHQHFVQQQLNVTQAMAKLIGFELGEDSLSLEVGITGEYIELADEIIADQNIGDKFIVIAPHVAPNLPPNLRGPRLYPLEHWLELLSMLDDEGYKVVIVGDPATDGEIIPAGISDNIIPAYTSNYRAIAGLIMRSEGVIASNNWYCVLARALKKKIVQAHSGGPLTWDAALYPKDSNMHGQTRVVTSISIRSIWPTDLLEAANDLFGELKELPEKVEEELTVSP